MGAQLDTSGEVMLSIAKGVPAEIAGGHRWSDLTPFCQGYIEAMPWAALIQGDDGDGLYWVPRFSDLAPATLSRIIEDCEADQDQGLRLGGLEDRSSMKAGRLFWQERQSGNLFDCQPLTPYLGDDGLIYLKDAT